MSQLIFKAKLINVEQSTNEKGLNMRLIFESERYDRGLEKMVPCSQNVKVIEDHHHMKDFYMSYRGREIYLPIEQSTMDRNIYYKTTGDGKPLQLEEKKAQDQKTPELSKV
ncbi:hypothetical protein L291_3977 [Acinetobacter guillouiae MSP4-18]|uniref:hypothetical protein n=1 Tax=Acinetobacter guillouiae TaxID=106649 RepID=UPI0002CDAF1D|nr:hypothetical protein [Acinetobacter guillouiae]ENU57591.1 hypothetical protein F981_01877 [Acinetobacter guillouiae CIP 63.46]ENU57601.1 hypothetical protein F981_01887 [Acinetobacter guillouiae CIP 63.46]EPH30777.1 hypothetical protein L291_3977 [Acinetobacter guillouiae MSP4-18]KAB0626711.1 hypothetical protein F7P82_08540 [Acinetobacter guillouiae]KAB0626719.1 hypothetical protein F7P82_08585 [Acinetobacter guillouiae]